MKQSILFFLLFCISVFRTTAADLSNNKFLLGDWIQVDLTMRDGSKIINRNINEIGVEYTITPKEIYIQDTKSQVRASFSYKYKDAQLQNLFSNQTYDIKFRNDTLQLLEKEENISEDRLQKMVFVKRQKFFSTYLPQYEEKTIVADRYTCPHFTTDLEDYLYSKINHRPGTKHLEGHIILDRDKKSAKVFFKEINSNNKSLSKKIAKQLDKSYNLWEFKAGVAARKYKIYFALRIHQKKPFRYFMMRLYDDSKILIGIELSNSNKTRTEKQPTKIVDSGKAAFFLREGIKAFNKKKYDLALEKFTKSCEFDPLLLDAFYNKAATHLELGEVEEACEVWQYLSGELGQVPAKNYQKEFCE